MAKKFLVNFENFLSGPFFAFLGFWSLAEENALPESTQTKILH